MAENSTSVLTNLQTNRIWVATNNAGTIDTSKLGIQSTNRPTYVHSASPGGGTRTNLYLYYSTVNSSGAFISNNDFYIPIIYQYNGENDSIIMLEQVANTYPNTKKNKFVAIQVGTGVNSFTAKIAEGDTLAEAISNRNQINGWNYKIKSSINANNNFRTAFGTSQSFRGSVAIDGGTSTTYTLSWDIAGDMIMTVSNTSSNRSYQYEIEVMEVSSTGINSEYTVKFLGMKDFGNKFGRFKFDRVSNATQIKVAIGSDEHKLNAAWNTQTSYNFTKNP